MQPAGSRAPSHVTLDKNDDCTLSFSVVDPDPESDPEPVGSETFLPDPESDLE